MIRKYALFALPLLIGFTVTPAYADWQYTKWGMSPEQVIKATGGKAEANNDEGRNNPQAKALLQTPYATERFDFLAVFMFNRKSNRLQYVSLELTEPARCGEAIEQLKDRYGSPLDDTGPGLVHRLTWRDTQQGNSVEATQIGDRMCHVMYSELADKKSGL